VTDRQILRLIGSNAKAARLQANITQECLAELVGIHWQTISYFENGKFPVSIAVFIRICQALNTSPNRLVEGIAEPDLQRMVKIKKALARKRKRCATGIMR